MNRRGSFSKPDFRSTLLKWNCEPVTFFWGRPKEGRKSNLVAVVAPRPPPAARAGTPQKIPLEAMEERRGQDPPDEWKTLRRGWFLGGAELKARLLEQMEQGWASIRAGSKRSVRPCGWR